MDVEWVRDYLNEALQLLVPMGHDTYGGPVLHSNNDDELRRRAPELAKVLNRVRPGAGDGAYNLIFAGKAGRVTTIVEQALYTLERGSEIDARLGPPPGPTLRADALHPTVWDAAVSLWRSEHYREAVAAAATAVNAQLQKKVDRRDVDNTALIEQSFSTEDPKVDAPRLRLWPRDGSKTYTNMQVGALAFGRGCYMGIRNVGAHEILEELHPQIALEQLAAFSILARWIEQAELITAAA